MNKGNKNNFNKVISSKKENIGSFNNALNNAMQVFYNAMEQIKSVISKTDEQIAEIEAQQNELLNVKSELNDVKTRSQKALANFETIVGVKS